MWRNAKAHAPKPMTVLASLFRSPEEVEKMDLRLKVSREEKNLALFLVRYRRELRKSPDEPDGLTPYADFIVDVSETSVTLDVFGLTKVYISDLNPDACACFPEPRGGFPAEGERVAQVPGGAQAAGRAPQVVRAPLPHQRPRSEENGHHVGEGDRRRPAAAAPRLEEQSLSDGKRGAPR